MTNSFIFLSFFFEAIKPKAHSILDAAIKPDPHSILDAAIDLADAAAAASARLEVPSTEEASLLNAPKVYSDE